MVPTCETKESEMTKDDSTTAGMQAIENGVKGALDQAYQNGYDQRSSEIPATPPPAGGGISQQQEQADIDAAVQAATGPLNDQISALKLSKSQEDSLLKQVQDSAQALIALLTPPPPPQPDQKAPAPAQGS